MLVMQLVASSAIQQRHHMPQCACASAKTMLPGHSNEAHAHLSGVTPSSSRNSVSSSSTSALNSSCACQAQGIGINALTFIKSQETRHPSDCTGSSILPRLDIRQVQFTKEPSDFIIPIVFELKGLVSMAIQAYRSCARLPRWLTVGQGHYSQWCTQTCSPHQE